MQLIINKVAVLGAGVMGAQIAAHFANCGFTVLLYDLPGRANDALGVLKKLKPNPLVTQETIKQISAFSFDDNNDLEKLKSASLIIEAVAENIEIKTSVYNKVRGFVNPQALFCTNTSGISINKLVNILAEDNRSLKSRFCGVHFFNPPRYQKLVELIPHKDVDPDVLDTLEEFLTRYLGKNIIRANDTPNFVANRIGVFSMLATMHNANKYNISIDVVDTLTGELIGRPKSATYRTADVVGLDTMSSVINTMNELCVNDPWREHICVPVVLKDLVAAKSLGQKTGQGFYRKNKNDIEAFDTKSKDYFAIGKGTEKIDAKLLEILKIKNHLEKFTQLKSHNNTQAQFLWSCFRDVWHYSAHTLLELGVSARDVDLALRWGFGWQQGPFELWQLAGWNDIAQLITQDIRNNDAMVKNNLPSWVLDKCSSGVYKNNTAYSPARDIFVSLSELNVYNRQYMPEQLLVEQKPTQNIVLENNGAKLWLHNNNFIFSFKTKANVITSEVLTLLDQAVDYISNQTKTLKSLVIWQDSGENFCAGADLNGFVGCVKNNDYTTMDNILISFQNICQKIKYINFPVIAAVKGMVLGGGTELMMHCDHVVAATETYIGLVEVGVGVIPAGGGCKEMLLRAQDKYNNVLANSGGVPNLADIDKISQAFYQNIATAKVSTSAQEALSLGYLKTTDTIIANHNELLAVAVNVINNMTFANYTAPVQKTINVGGDRIKANILALLQNYFAGGFISAHDLIITQQLAEIFSGGGVTSDSEVSQDWLLQLERNSFITLLKSSATQARINTMLQTGRPLRN